MAKRKENIQPSFDRLSERQLEIFASELQEHYHEERRLRRQLELRNQELEQRVNELLSLNKLFQKFMAQSFEASPEATLYDVNGNIVDEQIAKTYLEGLSAGDSGLPGMDKVVDARDNAPQQPEDTSL